MAKSFSAPVNAILFIIDQICLEALEAGSAEIKYNDRHRGEDANADPLHAMRRLQSRPKSIYHVVEGVEYDNRFQPWRHQVRLETDGRDEENKKQKRVQKITEVREHHSEHREQECYSSEKQKLQYDQKG